MNTVDPYSKLLFPFDKPIGQMLLWDNGTPNTIHGLFSKKLSRFHILKPIIFKKDGLQRLINVYSNRTQNGRKADRAFVDNISEIRHSDKVWHQDLPNPTGIRTERLMPNEYLPSAFPLMMPVDPEMIWSVDLWSDYLFSALWYSLYEPYYNKKRKYDTGIIGANSRISKGALLIPPYIIGDNVTIEAGTIISGSIIGNHCRIGQASIVRNAILGDGVSLPLDVLVFMSVINSGCVINSNIRFSVLDENVFIGGDVTISDMILASKQNTYREKKTILLNDEFKSDSNAVLLGCAIGANTRVGARTFLNPGISIIPNSRILPK